jgi:proteic killer suppression protein
MAIKSFKYLETQKLFDGNRVARWVNIERPALRKPGSLDWSSVLDDLRASPQTNYDMAIASESMGKALAKIERCTLIAA